MAHLEKGPFGNPDGARAEIENVLEGFITFGDEHIWGGLATRKDDRKARVIVGRKGSGKTVYLRRLHSDASAQDSLYTDFAIQQSKGLPTTDAIVRFSQIRTRSVTESWTAVWRAGLLCSVLTHIINKPELKERIPAEVLERLKSGFTDLLLYNYKTPVDVYHQITQTIEALHTPHKVQTYFTNPKWAELEWLLIEAIKNCPPLCFYIDAADEYYEHAPNYWMQFQLGLFYATMHLLWHKLFGEKLHFVVSLRDLVLSSVLRSEHRSRYVAEPHIRTLNWNRNAMSYFLNEKVRRLDESFFVCNTISGKNVATWLGMDSITNRARKTREPLEQHLLRHTRLLPRDIIILGNELCSEIQKARQFSPDLPIDQVIRQTVAECSKFFGDEQLLICGKQIASDTMPQNAGRANYSEVYTSDQEYIRDATDQLKDLICKIGKDRFSIDDLNKSREASCQIFVGKLDVHSVLWQNGLIGYTTKIGKKERFIFYSMEKLVL
jgi:hypothetical protein